MNKLIVDNQELPQFRKNAWMYSFLDLTLLLVCFFVLIFAATKDLNKDSDKIFESVREKFSAQVVRVETRGVEVIYDLLNSRIKESTLAEYIDIKFDDTKVSIIIPHKFLLKDGELTYEAFLVADFIVNSLFNITKNKVEIENLVDIDQILGISYPSTNEQMIEYSLESTAKIQKLMIDKGLRGTLVIKNAFKQIQYKNSRSIHSAVAVNIY